MDWDQHHYYFGWPGMLLVMVVFWGVVGAGVYLVSRWLGRDRVASDPFTEGPPSPGTSDPDGHVRRHGTWDRSTDRSSRKGHS